MSFLVKEEGRVKSLHKFISISKKLYQKDIIQKYLEEETTLETNGLLQEMNYDLVLLCLNDFYLNIFI